MFSPIEHPLLLKSFNPHRKLALTASGNADLYIALNSNSGTRNQYRVTIDLSSRYTNGGSPVTANSCNFQSYSRASNLVTSSTTFSFDLDTSYLCSDLVKIICDAQRSLDFYINVMSFCSRVSTAPATISEI
jgi:hypothetical protein